MADSHPTWRRRNQWYFRKNHVTDFLSEFRQLTSNPDKRLSVPLNHVLQYWRVSSAEFSGLLSAMRRTEIPFSMTSFGQLRDVCFEESALRNWLKEHRKNTTEWVSVTAAAGILGLKEEVVYELVAKNLLAATLIGSKGHFIRRISLQSLEQFRCAYISLAEIAKQNNTSSSALLRRINIKAVTGPRIDGGRQYFFKRSDIDQLHI